MGIAGSLTSIQLHCVTHHCEYMYNKQTVTESNSEDGLSPSDMYLIMQLHNFILTWAKVACLTYTGQGVRAAGVRAEGAHFRQTVSVHVTTMVLLHIEQ